MKKTYPTAPLAKSGCGVHVRFCGHDGYFLADLVRVGNCIVVRANGPVSPGNLHRKQMELATFHLSDSPGPNYWNAAAGVFVVHESQLVILHPERVNLSVNQVDILDHTVHRAAGGFYCGGDSDMRVLVRLKLMKYAGMKAGVPDKYYTITQLGREALKNAKGKNAARTPSMR